MPEEVSGNPTIFYTIVGNPASEKVIAKLNELHGGNGSTFLVLEEKEISQEESFFLSSVALWDGPRVSYQKKQKRPNMKNFTPVQVKQRPGWSKRSYWGLSVAENISDTRIIDCANQVYTWFQRTLEYLDQGNMPWGETKKGTFVLNGNVPRMNVGVAEKVYFQSSMGSFQTFPDYRVTYPEVVIEALGELFEEYNLSFLPLVEANREWDTDYQYAFHDGLPTNYAIQIDMLGLTESMLHEMESMSLGQVREALRVQIFEMENSLAMYQLLCKIGGENSFFNPRFRSFLDNLRTKQGRKVALLAVTEQKKRAMMETEFGRPGDGTITDEEVFQLTGFDRFFGPTEFLEYLETTDNHCDYLLYCRTSDPTDKLKDPTLVVNQPLLGCPKIRKIIKASSITFNIDAPEMAFERRINDTKGYMLPMSMGYVVNTTEDLQSLDFDNQTNLRAKPLVGTFGCYGHFTGRKNEAKFIAMLTQEIQKRGPYIIQREMKNSLVATSTHLYAYIDRIFMGVVDGKPLFLGGFRNMLPIDSEEVRKGRIHGNGTAVWVEIVTT